MFYNYYQENQYDSCVSNGICSIGPRTSSLQEILIMYLKLLAFYMIELQDFGGYNKDAEIVILNTISMLMSNIEYRNEQFVKSLIDIKTILYDSKKTYIKHCKEKDIAPKYIKSNIKFSQKIDITKLIQQGEQEVASKIKLFSAGRLKLMEIMISIIKSLAINILELKDYAESDSFKLGFRHILILLNFLNYPDTSTKDILDATENACEIDSEITKEIIKQKLEYYGESTETEVSLSTHPGKAILVAGNNLKELENLLEYTKDMGIDIYTHGEMIYSHTYPKFKQYNNLVGHYGIGINNSLLDFSTFPGAILITGNASENIEYLYRGRLFTTNYFVPQGTVKVENNDFSEVVQSALNAKGFKRGKQKESIYVGYTKSYIKSELDKFLDDVNDYHHVLIIESGNDKQNNKLYYDNIIKNIPKDFLIISSFDYKKIPNSISVNKIVDYSLINYLLENLEGRGLDITIFMSRCDKHTISNIINLRNRVKNIFLSKCSPILLNPTLPKILKNEYGIMTTAHPTDDLMTIIRSND